MKPDFFLKQNDTREPLERTLKDSALVAVDLTGATVKFSMRNQITGAVKVNEATATIVAPATGGKVRYSWAAADTNTPGDYWGEFEVTFGDGTINTFPNDRHIFIQIYPEVV